MKTYLEIVKTVLFCLIFLSAVFTFYNAMRRNRAQPNDTIEIRFRLHMMLLGIGATTAFVVLALLVKFG